MDNLRIVNQGFAQPIAVDKEGQNIMQQRLAPGEHSRQLIIVQADELLPVLNQISSKAGCDVC
jgi:hypothetical protein